MSRQAYQRKYRREHLTKIRARDRAYDKLRYFDPAVTLLRNAKKRAAKFGLKFNLTLPDITIPSRCPLLGIRLVRGKRIATDASSTLDRKKPHLGYVRGNVWVVSLKANRMKSNATLADMELLVKNWRRF